jgi:hypothetical protein
MNEEELRGSVAPAMPMPSIPWPLPKDGSRVGVEVARYRRESTSARNAAERVFFVRMRIVSSGLLRFIEFRSVWLDCDVVTGRVRFECLIPCGEAEMEIASSKEAWKRSSVVIAGEMKGRKVPASLEKVFSGIVDRVKEFASREEKRYQTARLASEERMEVGCF